jgi:enolase-phosphatase E1
VRLTERGVDHVLLDIEGTTTPLTFVRDVLFPYARHRLAGWLRDSVGTPERAAIDRRLETEHHAARALGEPVPAWSDANPSEQTASLAAFVEWLIDRDRKSPGLKELQGLIWERGYLAGEIRGEVYEDVPRAMRRWREEGAGIAIYSSGSELAQRLLFASTAHGDLTPLIMAFFDTAVGAKQETRSYARIAEALGKPPESVVFVSDIVAELDAARSAGFRTALAVRPGNPPVPDSVAHGRIRSLDEL